MAGSFDESGADLELVGVTKRFPGFTAIENLNLTIPAGSFFALLGPSGCGKTTTLRLVAGLEAPTAGRILIGGKDVTSTKPHQRPVNTVFQSYALFPHMTVLANVEFGLKRRGIANAHALAHEALRLVELDHVASRRPSQLSGGQQQRVGVARGLAVDPNILLMDEPFGAVDPIVRDDLQNELLRLQRDLGKTVVFVTHDIDEAFKLGDEVVIFRKGGIVAQKGTPAEILAAPADEFVATFVGADRGKRALHIEETPTGSVLVDSDGRTAGVLSAGPGSGGPGSGEAKAATVPVAGASAQGEDPS